MAADNRRLLQDCLIASVSTAASLSRVCRHFSANQAHRSAEPKQPDSFRAQRLALLSNVVAIDLAKATPAQPWKTGSNGADQMRYFDATGFPGRTVGWASEKPPAADISMPVGKTFSTRRLSAEALFYAALSRRPIDALFPFPYSSMPRTTILGVGHVAIVEVGHGVGDWRYGTRF